MISLDELKQLMEQHGFTEYVFRWDHDEEAYAIGVDNYSVLFLPRHNRIAIWPYRWTNRVRYFDTQKWLDADSEELVYRNVNPEWWERFKPVFRKIVDGFPVGPPLPSGFLNWIQGHRNVKWNRGVKLGRVMSPEPVDQVAEQPQIGPEEKPFRRQKLPDKISFMKGKSASTFPNLVQHLWQQIPRPVKTIEKRISEYLQSRGVSHVWSDSEGEHVLHFVDYVVKFDISNELIEVENRVTFQANTHGWTDWLGFKDGALQSCGISDKSWNDNIRPVILRVVQLLCGAYV
ncbi:hypothetical protein [Gimesia chilikensis]|uniref:hypothetical protein n=1 Tax=Gimesia chilikensis TaxID=2605989 RepID=UPI003A8EF212